MTEQPDVRTQAKQLYDAQDYLEAGKLYHQLWDEQGDAFSGGRYAYCLRKCGHAKAALTVAGKAAEKFPDDIYVRREVVWALYDAEFKPAKEKGDLGSLVHAGQQIVNLTDEELPVRLVSFAVIDLAKDKMKWDVVSAWCDRLDRQALNAEPREIEGRRVISEREQWYFAKIKSLVHLKRWDEVRALTTEALQAFPRKHDFARWAALALAGQGHVSEAIAELEALAQHGQPEWYLLNDLAELKLRNKQVEEAYRLACQAALAFGEDKAKVGLFMLIGQIALELQRFDVAARHGALSRLVRTREGWSVPGEVTRLETQARLVQAQAGGPPLDLPDEIPPLAARCRQDWEQAVPPELRPQPKEKRPRRSQPRPVDDTLHTGHVKMYKQDKGFGFIKPDNGEEDIFFHISNVRGVESPGEGMAVQYQVAEGQKGLNAVNVQPASPEP
jgi:cold shock CspA family protein/tetratricopeptide (TPR) repeat protein